MVLCKVSLAWKSLQDRGVCTFQFLGKMTSCVVKESGEREREKYADEGMTVYNISDDRNSLESRTFPNIISNYNPLKCATCHSFINETFLANLLWSKRNNTLQYVLLYENNAHQSGLFSYNHMAVVFYSLRNNLLFLFYYFYSIVCVFTL